MGEPLVEERALWSEGPTTALLLWPTGCTMQTSSRLSSLKRMLMTS